jgi:hypothetical protein
VGVKGVAETLDQGVGLQTGHVRSSPFLVVVA